MEIHLNKVRKDLENRKTSKVQRDTESQVEVVNDTTEEVTKKKRKFKRRYLQPQPQKRRKRKSKHHDSSENIVEIDTIKHWNGVIKNISGLPVSEAEENLFAKGQKFCPVELDPPIVRMQGELNRFFRMLRIKWIFDEKPDQRSELEKVFYEKSSWEPPRACKEIEELIKNMQERFDKWKPPRYIKDNLNKEERNLLKQIKENDDIVYKWEDKGPSFVKMTKEQYLDSGEKELEKPNFYKQVQDDPSELIKPKSDAIVHDMFVNDEISEPVSKFLLNGQKNLSTYYHLLKTHKIPQDVDNPTEWLGNQGYPIRGIISARGGPTERLAGFVD